jgi:dUTP pyrophosphatase
MWNPLDGLSTVNVGFKALNPLAQIPTYGSDEAAGADLYSIESVRIAPGDRKMVRTGVGIQLPKGFEAQVRPRSGLAAKFGITITNTPGTIDSDYRGEIMVILYNTGLNDFIVTGGDRIAQLVVVPVFRAKFIELDDLSTTARGHGGFGSTGTR